LFVFPPTHCFLSSIQSVIAMDLCIKPGRLPVPFCRSKLRRFPPSGLLLLVLPVANFAQQDAVIPFFVFPPPVPPPLFLLRKPNSPHDLNRPIRVREPSLFSSPPVVLFCLLTPMIVFFLHQGGLSCSLPTCAFFCGNHPFFIPPAALAAFIVANPFSCHPPPPLPFSSGAWRLVGPWTRFAGCRCSPFSVGPPRHIPSGVDLFSSLSSHRLLVPPYRQGYLSFLTIARSCSPCVRSDPFPTLSVPPVF